MLNLTTAGALSFAGGIQPSAMYYLNNLYSNTWDQVSGSSLDSVVVSLPSYGTAIYTVSTTIDTVVITNPLTAVRQSSSPPEEFALAQNYPNPFNPTTTIRFALPYAGWTTLNIYDVLGREVAHLVDGNLQAGVYTSSWDGRMTSGQLVGSGVYLYRLTLQGTDGRNSVVVKKMILVK
jgi:hypothetical protein